jgi:hypothetical protein
MIPVNYRLGGTQSVLSGRDRLRKAAVLLYYHYYYLSIVLTGG